MSTCPAFSSHPPFLGNGFPWAPTQTVWEHLFTNSIIRLFLLPSFVVALEHVGVASIDPPVPLVIGNEDEVVDVELVDELVDVELVDELVDAVVDAVVDELVDAELADEVVDEEVVGEGVTGVGAELSVVYNSILIFFPAFASKL